MQKIREAVLSLTVDNLHTEIKEEPVNDAYEKHGEDALKVNKIAPNATKLTKDAKTFPPKKCVRCGLDFVPYHNVQKQCIVCRNEFAHRAKIKIESPVEKHKELIKCRECGNEFMYKVTKLEKYCSPECRKKRANRQSLECIRRKQGKAISTTKINPLTGRPEHNDPFN